MKAFYGVYIRRGACKSGRAVVMDAGFGTFPVICVVISPNQTGILYSPIVQADKSILLWI